jgi:hypothetical protein
VKSVIVACGLVFLMAGPARAVCVQCKTFDRSDTQAPQFVQEFLDGSNELLVRVCGLGGFARYYRLGNPVRDGNVCRYSMYDLNLSRTSPPRLERTANPSWTFMSVSESSTCPLPEAGKYAATNSVPQDVFEHLVHVWHAAITSPASCDGTLYWGVSWTSSAYVLSRLRNAILRNRSSRLNSVQSVRMLRHTLLWKSYEIDVADPDDSTWSYHVTVSSWFGRIYGISHAGGGMC